MDATRQRALNLLTLAEGMPGLTPACGTSLAESAAVCLEDRSHKPGVPFNVTGAKPRARSCNMTQVSHRHRLKCSVFGAQSLARSTIFHNLPGVLPLLPFNLTGLKAEQFPMVWPSVDEQQRRSYNDLQEATERGAYGIAILIVCDLTGKVVVERSKKGPGFDYWLGDEDDDLMFSGKARLEVSGILSGSTSLVQARVRQKKEQVKPSDYLAPGYIAVVEFGVPTACVENA